MIRLFASTLIIFTLALTQLLGADEPLEFKAGAASVVITPEGPMWMAGYAARIKPASGKTHDPRLGLWMKTLTCGTVAARDRGRFEKWFHFSDHRSTRPA